MKDGVESTLDLPGYGKTPGPDWIKNNDQMVEVVVDFIEETVPSQHFAIIGDSYGGYLARGVVHYLFNRVDGLCLWTPALYPRSERKPRPPRGVRVKNDEISAGLKTESEKEIFNVLVLQTKEAMDFVRAYMTPAFDIADAKFSDRIEQTKFSFDFDLTYSRSRRSSCAADKIRRLGTKMPMIL